MLDKVKFILKTETMKDVKLYSLMLGSFACGFTNMAISSPKFEHKRNDRSLMLSDGMSESENNVKAKVANDELAIVKLLLDKGADVNAKSDEGYTPLHYATNDRNFETVEELIRRGADINAKTLDNLTPLHFATLPKNSSSNE